MRQDRESGALAAWGRIVHRRRGIVLALSALLLVGSVAGILRGGTLETRFPEDTEAGRGAKLLQRELPQSSEVGFTLVFTHPTLKVDDPEFRAGVDAALAPLRADARVAEVETPWTVPAPLRGSFVSRDGAGAIAAVVVASSFNDAREFYAALRTSVSAPGFEVLATDGLAVNDDFDRILADDLERAEIVSLPIVLLLLILVFGTLVAAILPVGVGILAVAGGIAGIYVLSGFTDVASYAVNIVTLIGLGVAIDYSLFVVSRFREEIETRSTEDALARTLGTAGRATLFSGITVAIGLSGLLFFQGSFLASMGLGGTLVVLLAVGYSLTFLPAVLSFLGPRVSSLRLFRPKTGGSRFWHGIATGVMRRPLLVLLPIVVLLLAAGAPFQHIRLANGDVEVLPREAESRMGYERILAEFPGRDLTNVLVIVEYPHAPLTPERVGALYDYSRILAGEAGALRVESIFDVDPNLTRADYVNLLPRPRDELPPGLRAAVERTVGDRIVALSVLTGHRASSDEARDLVRTLRASPGPDGATVHVTGTTAFDIDTIRFILERAPTAVTFVLVVTFALLLVLVGSVLLPAKAILMNLLSITASFGALVYIFQDGNFSDFLAFTPNSIDPTLPVIMFCVTFGLSMDYEVFLLSRIQEEYERSGDNEHAVAVGLEASGRIITGAAAIMVVVFSAFALSGVLIVKAIGLGLAIAIALDATFVRALLVPATMRLLGEANWWAPRWIRRLHEAI